MFKTKVYMLNIICDTIKIFIIYKINGTFYNAISKYILILIFVNSVSIIQRISIYFLRYRDSSSR